MGRRRIAVAFLLLLLSASLVRAADDEGDRKIRDTVERAEEAEERAKRDRPAPDRDSDDEEEGEGGLLAIIARAFFEAFFTVLFESEATLRFAAYPYSPRSEYLYTTSTFDLPEETKWASLQLTSDAATHLDGTWGNSNRLIAQLAGFHINVYNLSIFAETQGFSVLSANAGITLFAPGFLLSGFAGAWTLDVLDRAWFSFGFSCRLFLPGRVHVDLFNLNAAIGEEVWSHWEAAAGVSLWRFAFGAGWHHNLIAGAIYSGPCLRADFWW